MSHYLALAIQPFQENQDSSAIKENFRSIIAHNGVLQHELVGYVIPAEKNALISTTSVTSTFSARSPINAFPINWTIDYFSFSSGISMITSNLNESYETFEREKSAFMQIKEKLLNDPAYVDKYVAVVGENVVDWDNDNGILAERVYKKYGYIPLFIGKITRKRRIVELPSPERA